MKVRVTKIEMSARHEARPVVLLSRDGKRSIWICHAVTKVVQATVLEVVCDDGCDSAGFACRRIVTPPVLQAANSRTPHTDLSRSKEMAA